MTATLIGLAAAACDPSAQSTFEPKPIDPQATRLTPEIMWSLGRVGQPSVSTDGQTVVYGLTHTNIAENRNYSDLYTIATEGGQPVRLTQTREGEMQPCWTPDGRHLTYVKVGADGAQLWQMNPDGTDAKQLTHADGGIDGYVFAPDQSYVAYIRRVKVGQTLADRHPDMPHATARMETDLMYRHWNEWADGKYSHVCIAPYADGELGKETDIMDGEPYHCPLPPFGGIEHLTFSPDGKQIVYACKKLMGMAAAKSTNSGLYLYDIASGETTLLTPGQHGYDTNPLFAPDGQHLLWLSMERDGYESDKNRLMMRDMATGETTELTDQTENHTEAFCLSADGRTAYTIAGANARVSVWAIDIAMHAVRAVNTDLCDWTSIVMADNNTLVGSRMSMMSPPEIYTIDIATGKATQLTHINDAALTQLDMGTVTERWIETTDGKQMHTWVILPPGFDANKKYPALLYCQGGPQSMVSQFWSLRWNMALMASRGYVVVAPNRRGLPGFGREWNEQISGDYGGQNMQDYLSAIDAVGREPWVDADRLGAVGASYGGYSVYWLAGHHEGRFKTLIAHCGVFDYAALYATTEELFFPDWDLKGAPWETDNQAAQKSYGASPSHFVNNWDTPIMVIHGEKDFRIPYTQGMAAFNTAVMKGIPAQFLFFPDECHWVQKPQNSIVWHREFGAWLDRWLKD